VPLEGEGEGVGLVEEPELLGVPVEAERGSFSTVTYTVLVTVTAGGDGIGGLELDSERVGWAGLGMDEDGTLLGDMEGGTEEGKAGMLEFPGEVLSVGITV
jgi:hypothetical protein